MKTQLLFLVALFIGSNTYSGNNEPAIVITKNDTAVGKKATLESDAIAMKMYDGTTKKINANDVISLTTSDGKIYERRELYLNNKSTGKFVLMELLGQKSGLRLYRYDFKNAPEEIVALKNSEKIENHSVLLIFKEENFYVQLTKANAPAILDIFNLSKLVFEV